MPIALVIIRRSQDVADGRDQGLASGIWPSVSGAAAQAQNVDMIANNLANADTLGFKKDMPTFHEYLAAKEREHGGLEIPRGPIKDKEFYPLDGRDQSFVIIDGTYTNFKQGSLRVTNSPLDVALDGSGFLEIATPNGVRYTRQGSLHMAADGRLVTTDGYPVLSSAPAGVAAPVPTTPQAPAQSELGQRAPANAAGIDAIASQAARFINLADSGSQFSISPQGEIYSGNNLIAKLSVVEFGDTRKLRKGASQTFSNPDVANAAKPSAQTVVRQGVLETSNVNPIEEMTNLIKASRLFEHDLKAMKTYGEMMQREANDIGKL